jgi:hypothetical protein
MPRIELYPEALSRLNAARTSGDAIAVVVAYVRPKVDARGETGSPLLAFNSLEMDVSGNGEEQRTGTKLTPSVPSAVPRSNSSAARSDSTASPGSTGQSCRQASTRSTCASATLCSYSF